MRLELDARETHSVKAGLKSFKHASQGLLTSFLIGRNIKVHYTIAMLVIGCGLYFRINKVEFVLLLLTIAQVLTLEMVNTAIEKTVDLITSDYHIYAKIAKDVAAGAVLFSAIIAVIIGGIIFLPYLLGQ